MPNFVAYYRVSRETQGRSGLGLEAQQKAVFILVAGRGDGSRLIASYQEVESGKDDGNRPELKKAIERAKLTGSVLLIAKLDRLSRDAHFLLGLQKAEVAFTCCDMPQADNFTVGLFALLAQKERELISTRTKEALAAAKARGVRLGCPNGAAHLRKYGTGAAVKAVKRKAVERALGLERVIQELKQEGLTSPVKIAQALTERDYKSPRGGPWNHKTVRAFMTRIDLAKAA